MYAPRAFAVAPLVIVVFIAACPGPDPQTVTGSASTSGSGSGGVSSATSSVDVATTTSTGVAPDTTSSTGVMAMCTNDPDSQCPQTGTACVKPACAQGACTKVLTAAHTGCNDNGGSVCDGNGACVVCVDDSDCKNESVCVTATPMMSQCVPPLVTGTQCNSATACASHNCVDNVCCDLPCAGMCTACTAVKKGSGNDGSCGPVAAGTDPDLSCTTACNGQGGCLAGKRVFVTSVAYPGTFGSASAADDLCKAAAQHLGGTWAAWVSDSGNTPAKRFTQSTVPYLRLDLKPIASDWKGLTSGTLLAPIDIDETKAPVDGNVWTGTYLPPAVASSNVCLDWKGGTTSVGDVGSSSATTSAWTQSGQLSCAMEAHLYCFEQ